MKYSDLSFEKQINLIEDLRRLREENEWENNVIGKALRRSYDIEIDTKELLKLERRNKISCRNEW